MDYLPSALTVAKTIGTVASLVASSLAVLVYKRSLARKAREENKYKPPIDEAGWSKIFPEVPYAIILCGSTTIYNTVSLEESNVTVFLICPLCVGSG